VPSAAKKPARKAAPKKPVEVEPEVDEPIEVINTEPILSDADAKDELRYSGQAEQVDTPNEIARGQE
jgi:hypothetical protein